MHLKEIQLNTSHISVQKEFYSHLGFDIHTIENGFWLQAGTTKFSFVKADQPPAIYHFAFLVCDDHFKACLEMVKSKRIAIIPDRETGEEITWWENDTGKSFYFYDRDGNIAEFISRPTLNYRSAEEWSVDKIVKVNEIGTPVSDPYGVSHQLLKEYNFQIPEYYRNRFDDQFCWFGDYEGTLLVVKEGRNWYPTQIAAGAGDLTLKIVEADKTISLAFKDGVFSTLNV